jgi:hypothetical protein
LHELLIACESRLVSADGNTVAQEAHDGIAGTAHTKDAACSEIGASASDSTTPARPRSRRRATAGNDSGGAPSCSRVSGASPGRGERHRHAGGR